MNLKLLVPNMIVSIPDDLQLDTNEGRRVPSPTANWFEHQITGINTVFQNATEGRDLISCGERVARIWEHEDWIRIISTPFVAPRKMPRTINEACDFVSVHAPGQWENDEGPKGWYAISSDHDGIVAYAGTENLALHIRLAIINALLNPLVHNGSVAEAEGPR